MPCKAERPIDCTCTNSDGSKMYDDLGNKIIYDSNNKIQSNYAKTLHTLACMNDDQMKEMFEDLVELAGIEKIEQLSEKAYSFSENYEEPEEHGTSDFDEWRAIDDARRYRELQT